MSVTEAPRRVALITGASAGLGASFARQFAKRGADLILVARRVERLARLSKKLQEEHGVHCEILAADLATDAGIEAVKDKICATPQLTWLVNNAGFATKGRFFTASLQEQDRMHRLHVIATLHLSHAALRPMVARGDGAVINVASVAGFLLSAGSVGYAATKSWMHVFTEGIYVELKASGSAVRVQSLCPGYTRTEFHDVLGMDPALIPNFLWLDADFVAEESLRALNHNQLWVVPSWKYRLILRIARLLPRKILYLAAARAGRYMKRDGPA
jgi:short-subunit dehydrogenase